MPFWYSNSLLARCRARVVDAGPTLNQHWVCSVFAGLLEHLNYDNEISTGIINNLLFFSSKLVKT